VVNSEAQFEVADCWTEFAGTSFPVCHLIVGASSTRCQ